MREFGFSSLADADLVVDAVYRGGDRGHAGDDPLQRLLGCGVGGGFRFIGSTKDWSIPFVVLYSSMSDPDWPDTLSVDTGNFIYFGDNKTPGGVLHSTKRGGNEILRHYFEEVHNGNRGVVPPFFVFTKHPEGRSVVFRGVAVPGAQGMSMTEDLVAIWRSKEGERFQNYRAVFTILDIPVVTRR